MLTFARCLPALACAFALLACAACGDSSAQSEGRDVGVRDPSVDSSDTRAHRLMQLVARADTLTTLARALRQTGLAQDLRETGPYTLIAPTDAAFQQYWPGFDSLLAPAGRARSGSGGGTGAQRSAASSRTAPSAPMTDVTDSLRTLLRFHLMHGRFGTNNIEDSLRISTLTDESLLLERRTGSGRGGLRVRVTGRSRPVRVQRTFETQNGVLHVVPRPLRQPRPDTSGRGVLDSTEVSAAAPGGGA